VENINDYIYYIIVAIAVIASFLGKSKKKTVSRNPGPTETAPQDWGDVFGELFGTEKPEPQPQPQPAIRPVNQPVASPEKRMSQPVHNPAISSIGKLMADKERIKIIHQTEIAFADVEENTGGLSLDDIPNDAEEWRKVFVYNEIFRRKY
jgi:hypothetical protein